MLIQEKKTGILAHRLGILPTVRHARCFFGMSDRPGLLPGICAYLVFSFGDPSNRTRLERGTIFDGIFRRWDLRFVCVAVEGEGLKPGKRGVAVDFYVVLNR